MEREEMIDRIYNTFDEETRLTGSRQGQLEYLTTMQYIHKLVTPGTKVLEVGAGTGRYSIELAKEGYDVTAVELVEHNLDILRKNAQGMPNLLSFRGDATDLRAFADNSFNAVLLLGPMYHLYEREEQNKALDEAIRVTKPGGILMTAFLSVYAIMHNNFLSDGFREGRKLNFDAKHQVRHFKEQVFTGFDIEEFEALFVGKPVQKIALLGTDNVLELAEKADNFHMTEEDFQEFADYHLQICEKRELLGIHSHLLYICQKA